MLLWWHPTFLSGLHFHTLCQPVNSAQRRAQVCEDTAELPNSCMQLNCLSASVLRQCGNRMLRLPFAVRLPRTKRAHQRQRDQSSTSQEKRHTVCLRCIVFAKFAGCRACCVHDILRTGRLQERKIEFMRPRRLQNTVPFLLRNTSSWRRGKKKRRVIIIFVFQQLFLFSFFSHKKKALWEEASQDRYVEEAAKAVSVLAASCSRTVSIR